MKKKLIASTVLLLNSVFLADQTNAFQGEIEPLEKEHSFQPCFTEIQQKESTTPWWRPTWSQEWYQQGFPSLTPSILQNIILEEDTWESAIGRVIEYKAPNYEGFLQIYNIIFFNTPENYQPTEEPEDYVKVQQFIDGQKRKEGSPHQLLMDLIEPSQEVLLLKSKTIKDNSYKTSMIYRLFNKSTQQMLALFTRRNLDKDFPPI